jgi:hypothetical protein
VAEKWRNLPHWWQKCGGIMLRSHHQHLLRALVLSCCVSLTLGIGSSSTEAGNKKNPFEASRSNPHSGSWLNNKAARRA